MKNQKLVSVEEFFAGTAHFDKEFYVPNSNGGFILKDDILKKLNEEAEFRWNNGEKEIYEKYQTIPGFEHTEEFKNYVRKFNL